MSSWSLSGALGSPSVEIFFSPPRERKPKATAPARKPLADATHATNNSQTAWVSSLRNHKAVAKTPEKSVRAAEEALWDQMMEEDAIQQETDETWQYWEGRCNEVDTASSHPIRTFVCGVTLLSVYIFLVAAAAGFTLFPDAPSTPLPVPKSRVRFLLEDCWATF